jgi:hypothetical protein
VSEGGSAVPGYRFFAMAFDQPQDHADPAGARFQQRLTLMHRDCEAPTVIYNSGYFVSTAPARTEVTRFVAGNQLSMEHRFFGSSRAEPADWTRLDIAQAAADQHAVVQAFKATYPGRWLSAGVSKGGMTSIFHRRFYPDDTDGTVAYVAPIVYADDAVPGPANRFIRFLEEVGTDPACRQALGDFQRRVLSSRTAMKTAMAALATQRGTSFDLILGLDRALEFATEELPFLFWQYGDQGACAAIPGAGAPDEEVFAFLDGTVDVYAYSDADLTAFLPYYHQAATQLGYPVVEEGHLSDLLLFPGQDRPLAYVPPGIPVPAYSDAAMRDVQAWVHSGGRRILLVYGQNDPWSAGAIDIAGAEDAFQLYVPAGNHSSRVADLPEPGLSIALDAIARWSGTVAVPLPVAPAEVEADLVEPRRRLAGRAAGPAPRPALAAGSDSWLLELRRP